MKYKPTAVMALTLVLTGTLVWLLAAPRDEPRPEIEAVAHQPSPDRLRLDLVETLKKESLAETIANLPNYDDVGYTSGSIGSREGSYEHARFFFPRLNRVKRILEHAESNRAWLDRALVERLETATAKYPKALRIELDRADKAGGSFTSTGPSEYDACLAYGGACTYLLDQLHVHVALPSMSRIIRRKSLIPVNRIFLYYAMHRLVVTHPVQRLSADARRALSEYIKCTAWLPGPRRIRVASAVALVDEGDLRQNLLGIDVGLPSQPCIELDIYPQLEMVPSDPRYSPAPVEKLQTPLRLMIAFVDRAYVDARGGKVEPK